MGLSHSTFLRAFSIVIAFCSAYVTAEPTLAMSTIDPNVVKAQISAIQQLRESTNLSSTEQDALDELWRKASQIEAMNDKCQSISLTEEIDQDCGKFYQYELPKFETEFFKVTGEIRLSPTRLSNAIEQRRNAITQCFEALQVEAFHPSRFLSLEGKYAAEPLSQGVEVSYNFSLVPKEDAVTELNRRMQQWNDICGSIVLHSDNSGHFAPLFEDLIKQSRKNAPDNGGLYFEAKTGNFSNGKSILQVKNLYPILGTYYLNGKQLFTHAINKDETLFLITIKKSSIQSRIFINNQWNDKIVFEDQDVANGLIGRFVWKTVTQKNPSGPVQPSAASYGSTSKKSYDDDFDDESPLQSATNEKDNGGFGIAFQMIAGVNIAFGSVEGKAEEYFGFHATEYDSLSQINSLVGGQLIFEFNKDFAIAFGGGIAWHSVTLNECSYYESCEDYDLSNNYAIPMAQAEINFGFDVNWGTRFTYVFDPDIPTFYWGGFVELANLVGLEIGWVHTENVWDNVYMGLYFRLPPRHFSERLGAVKKK